MVPLGHAVNPIIWEGDGNKVQLSGTDPELNHLEPLSTAFALGARSTHLDGGRQQFGLTCLANDGYKI